MDWKKLGYVFAASFIVSGLTVACALAPVLSDRVEIVGFWGSIAGGMVGGAMTLAAGWLAWTAAQRQIATQMTILQLTTDEHLKRTYRMLHNIAHAAGRLQKDAHKAINEAASPMRILRTSSFPMEECDPIAGGGLTEVITDPDFWRIDFKLSGEVRRAQLLFDNFNNASRRDLFSSRPVLGRTVKECMAIAVSAGTVAAMCYAESQRLSLMSHGSMHPEERPAS
ncbi:hypothetical protein [Xanthobacter sp. 126]|uniref:hypothetical protein n=1 Tax=Xanthobacter sp. 126 TaxID=1131814 RepID=UPI0012DCD21E|nr:hypothetical protein [Xanthobacter sp. 126]